MRLDPVAGGAGHYLGNVLAVTGPTVAEAAASTEPAGSRRRKLWDLPQGTLCPLMGVCLPIATLRRVLGKTLGGTLSDDYQVQCTAINECTHRSASCDALQRELELRHALALQRFAKAKTTDAVAALWHEDSVGSDPVGALWAGLTHPRCDNALRERICSDIHMLQHQLGAGNRADLQRLQALTTEHTALKRELAATQERSARALAERSTQLECLAAKLMRLRAEGIQKDSVIATLRDAAVLCVGGRTASVPAYRRLIEVTAATSRTTTAASNKTWPSSRPALRRLTSSSARPAASATMPTGASRTTASAPASAACSSTTRARRASRAACARCRSW